ncbi:hypothetical protein [Asticcacaulis sp. AC466]|nr:hypothetical protein [Asticcacaulis sp. AC466]
MTPDFARITALFGRPYSSSALLPADPSQMTVNPATLYPATLYKE